MKCWLAILILGLTGCAGPQAAIREKASADLHCAGDKLQIAPLPKGGGYKAEGCGDTGHYYAICNIFDYCPNVIGENVSALLRRQAAFDLQCTEGELEIVELSFETFGAKGCGRQASYVLVMDRGAYKIVQNTQTQ